MMKKTIQTSTNGWKATKVSCDGAYYVCCLLNICQQFTLRMNHEQSNAKVIVLLSLYVIRDFKIDS